MSRTSRAEWAKRVERWQDSGLTAKEFAAETGLKPSTLTYWKWRLRTGSDQSRVEAVGGTTPRSPRPRRKTATSVAEPRFVEVSPIAPTPSSAAMLAVVLQDGTVVRVPTDFDETTLGRVVRTLEAAR